MACEVCGEPAGSMVSGSARCADPRRATEAGEDVARAMFEPPQARHSRHVWASGGHTHVELAAPPVESRELGRAVRRQLERLDGVEWAAVNDAVGRVLVAFDRKRVRVEDVVGVITAVEQARGGKRVFPQREEHPGDLEPLVAALVTTAVDVAAIGVAFAGKLLPVPALTRHATVALSLLDSQPWIGKAINDRIGPIGTDLVFTSASALLHSLTQSPHAEALLKAVTEAGHRLVLTEHAGTHELAGLTDEVADASEPLVATVRRLQADGHGVLVVSAAPGPALMAADVGVAPVRPGRPPAWGADLVTGTGLVDACHIVSATEGARSVSERSVSSSLAGNVLGSLLAAVGSSQRGQKEATTPSKAATAVTIQVVAAHAAQPTSTAAARVCAARPGR
jgi:cation-transporting P-type ATPase I